MSIHIHHVRGIYYYNIVKISLTSPLTFVKQNFLQEAVLDAIHETVVNEQVHYKDLCWTGVFRKVRANFPASFPNTRIPTNGGRSCQLRFNK